MRLRRSGADGCQGLVQFYDPASNTLLQSCNSEAGDSEVKVICRQLGCTTDNARKVDPSRLVASAVSHASGLLSTIIWHDAIEIS